MDMKRRILSCFLAFCMIFALLPAPAQAVETAGNAENAAPTVTATVQHAETGQITAQIEAYMTDPANKDPDGQALRHHFFDRAVKIHEYAEWLGQFRRRARGNPERHRPPVGRDAAADHRRQAPHCDRGLRPHQQPRHRRQL